MLKLKDAQIGLRAQPASKKAAIREVGRLLIESGCIDSAYIQSMMKREAVANTYLGNGIAIPHGMQEDSHLIKQTGIAVLQVPAGVAWNPGEQATLLVGIAAKSGEHIDMLRRLTRVLGNKEQVRQLTHTSDKGDIIEALTGERPVSPPQASDLADFAHYVDAIIEDPVGFHARPAALLVDTAKQFEAEVRVRYGQQVVNGKSVMALLQLGVPYQGKIRLSAEGRDAQAALLALQAAIAQIKQQAEEEKSATPDISHTHNWQPQSVGATIEGISASRGLAIGSVYQYAAQTLVVKDEPGTRLEEANHLQRALDTAQEELNRLHDEVKVRFGANKAAIFRAHAEFLQDVETIRETVSVVFKGHSAAWAWQQVIQARVAQMQKLDDPVLAARAVDLSDVGQRVLRHLTGATHSGPTLPPYPVILIADDLTPSDTASFNSETILGFCTAKGGPTSHTAIMARSLGIPALVGAGEQVLNIGNDTSAILDGFTGNLYTTPSEQDVEQARRLQRELEGQQAAAKTARFEPAITTDGHQVEIAANINRAKDVPQAVDEGAEGVGLMRTEFLFLERDAAPSEEQQFEVYRDMIRALDGRPLIIRTLDIGGDKEVPYLNLPKEDNSFLGIRGIRLCLARPDLFKPQLRAIFRASAYGPVHMMFPMIATLEEFGTARSMAEMVRKELNAAPIPIGIMIEVPSAVVLADQFAQEVDFFSIGTNDLTQYTLAMDRLHPQLAKQADSLHPAVLRMIDQTVKAAQRANKWVGVCGGIAGDPQGAMILTGLGVSELSVSIPNIAAIKAQIRSLSFAQIQKTAQQALQCRSAAEVRNLL